MENEFHVLIIEDEDIQLRILKISIGRMLTNIAGKVLSDGLSPSFVYHTAKTLELALETVNEYNSFGSKFIVFADANLSRVIDGMDGYKLLEATSLDAFFVGTSGSQFSHERQINFIDAGKHPLNWPSVSLEEKLESHIRRALINDSSKSEL